MKSKILLVDDAKSPMKGYINILRDTYDVKQCDGAVFAENVLKELAGRFACAIIDVMMPPPPSWGAGTQCGFKTGIVLLRRVRDQVTSDYLPIIVLTNRDRQEITADVNELNLFTAQVQVLAKLTTQPRELLAAVNAAVAWGKRKRKTRLTKTGPGKVSKPGSRKDRPASKKAPSRGNAGKKNTRTKQM
ncbi:MAG: hypothetical protein ABMA13_10540 [Chthoniobacteraceae bacterium]